MSSLMKEIEEGMVKEAEKEIARQVEQGQLRQKYNPTEAVVRGFGDMLTFGNVDDIAGTLVNLKSFFDKTGTGSVMNPTLFREFVTPEGEAAKKEQQTRSEEAQKAYPYLYGTGQATGIIVPIFTPYLQQARIAKVLGEGVKSWKAWGTATGLGVTAESLSLMGQDKFNYLEAIADGTMMGIFGWSLGGIGNRIAPPVIDFIKRQYGGRLSNKAMELLGETMARENQSPDQAIVSVIKQMRDMGLSPVEASKDLTDMLDNLANTNPAVMKLVKGILDGDELFATSKIKTRLGGDLAPDTKPDTNIHKYFSDIQEEITNNQKAQYKQVFEGWMKNKNVPPEHLTNAVHHILKNDPEMARILLNKIKRNKLLKNTDDYRPVNEFFEIGKEGEIIFKEAPSLEAMEILRRAMNNRVGKIFKNQSSELDVDDADVFNRVETDLRTKIDDASLKASKKNKTNDLASVRQQYADEKFALEQYDKGRKLLSAGKGDIEKVMVDIDDVVQSGNEQALDYLKLGLMNRINNMFSKASSAAGSNKTELDTFLTKLAKDGSSERLIYEALFPNADIGSTIKLAKRALEARRVSGTILTGTQTSKRMTGGLYAQRGGSMDIADAVIDTATLGAPVRTLFEKLRGLTKKYKGSMSQSEMLDLARFALSKDPDYVERVLDMSDAKAYESLSRVGSKLYGTLPVTVGMLGSIDPNNKKLYTGRMF